jgi:hypothetical protein
MRNCRYLFAVGIVAFTVGFVLNAAGQELRPRRSSFRFDDPMSFMRIAEYEEFQRAVSEIDQGSDSRRAMLVDRLKEMLGDESRITLRGYPGNADASGLTRRGGRARWLIEHILQKEPGNSNLSVDARINLWHSTVAQRYPVTESTTRNLREKYRGTIRSGIGVERIGDSIAATERFFDEWFPYGKRLADLEEITGVRLIREGEEAVLRIDSGIFGVEYRFRLNNGVIQSVKRLGLD